MMEVKMLSKATKNVVNGCKKCCNVVTETCKKHPVASAVVATAYIAVASACINPEFWSDTFSRIKGKVSGEKVSEEEAENDTYKDTYDEYIASLSANDLAKELDTVDRILSLQKTKLSRSDNDVDKAVIGSCISRNNAKRYSIISYVNNCSSDVEFKVTEYMKLYETIHTYMLVKDYVNISIEDYRTYLSLLTLAELEKELSIIDNLIYLTSMAYGKFEVEENKGELRYRLHERRAHTKRRRDLILNSNNN